MRIQASAALSGQTQPVIASTTVDGQVQAGAAPSGGMLSGAFGVGVNDEGGTPRIWKVLLRDLD